MIVLSLDSPEIPPDAERVDAIEFRLDLFACLDREEIEELLRCSPKPVLLTYQGATAPTWLQELQPAYFDWVGECSLSQRISSYHHFDHIPQDLSAIYAQLMRQHPFCCKMAAMVHSTSDALRMLCFAKRQERVCMIPMGEKGAFARILGPVVGNQLHFVCAANHPTAPGQWTLRELEEVYHFRSLNRETAIYGLIGHPVEQSMGAHYHNRVFRERNRNAVYVKMSLLEEELEEFFPLAQELGIQGLSVTAPLKEAVLPFLHTLTPQAKQIGAVNTIRFEPEGKRLGTNTDGTGALDAIERHSAVQGKTVALIGAGGVARAIAYESRARGARVVVWSRTMSRAEKLAAALGCEAGELPTTYDVLINCCSVPMPILPEQILPYSTVFDVNYSPKETLFTQAALEKKCRVVYGEEMFLNQAAKQTAFWGI